MKSGQGTSRAYTLARLKREAPAFTPLERVALGERRGRPGAEIPQKFAELSGRETSDVAAEKAGFDSGKTFERAKKVVADGAPELVQAMDDGKVSVSAAADVATLPVAEQREVVARGPTSPRQRVR